MATHANRRASLETDARYQRARADAASNHVTNLETLVRDMFGSRDTMTRALHDARASLQKARADVDALRTERILHRSECTMLRALNASSDVVIEQFRDLTAEYRNSERATASRIDELERRGSCSICLSARADRLTVPCSHCAMCRVCCDTLLAGDRPRCPVCRAPFGPGDVTTVLFP
jgi:hypothetical protein